MKSEQHKKKAHRKKKAHYQQKPEPLSISFFEKCDAFFTRHEKIWFWAIMGITLLTCLMLYDPRVSAGGDDSAYIVIAIDFLNDFKFVNYQGPLYSIVLSVVYAIFGMSLKAFKVFSMLSMLGCVYFLYMAFRKRIPATLLFVTLLLTSLNSHVMYFASQTYSEAFYMFLQSLLLFVFFRLSTLRPFLPSPLLPFKENLSIRYFIKPVH